LAEAQYALGVFFEQGRGGQRQDDREAARLFKLAADQGHAAAQYNLAVFFERGRGGLRQDDREAARLYKLAADRGDAFAQAALAGSRGLFSRLFGGWADARDGRRQKREELEQQREAADRAQLRRRREEQERQREAAERERHRRWQEEEQERQREAAERERQKRQEEHDRRRNAASGDMSVAQALEILGINAGTSEHDIHAAYNRLMKRVHPDVGGSAYFTKELNAARDALLKQLRAET
jgi:TPR repeat protein